MDTEETHTSEDWADGKVRNRENNPIYSGTFTLVDYYREWLESRHSTKRFTEKSKEIREFTKKYLKSLNEEDDGPELERYRRIVMEALSRYDGPTEWGHGFGENWKPTENTGRILYYSDIYERTDEEAIDLILSEMTDEAAKWTFLESIYDDVLRELRNRPEWMEDELEIGRIYNQGNGPDGTPYKPDIERFAENSCRLGIDWRHRKKKLSRISTPEEEQEYRRTAIEAIVSEALERHKEDLEAAKEFEATGKLRDSYRVYDAVMRTTGKAPKMSENGEMILDRQDLPLASSVPAFIPDELQPRNKGLVLERHRFTSNMRTATIEEIMDGLGLGEYETRLESQEFEINDVNTIKANLFINSLVGKPSELEIDLALQIGLYLEKMVEYYGQIQPIGVYDLIKLFYGIPSGAEIRPEHAKEMDTMLRKLMATKIFIDPSVTNLPQDGILKGAIGVESPLLSYTRIVYLNDDRKTTVSKYLFDKIPILWTMNKAIGLYTLTDLELISTPTYTFDSKEWKELDMDAGTRRRIIQHHDKEKLIMRRNEPGLYMSPYKTLGIKKWVLKNLGITISYDRDRKYGTVNLNLEKAYKEIYDTEIPPKKSMKWADFKKRLQMYLLYLMAWGYIEDYTTFTSSIQVRYSDRAKVQIADVIRNP